MNSLCARIESQVRGVHHLFTSKFDGRKLDHDVLNDLRKRQHWGRRLDCEIREIQVFKSPIGGITSDFFIEIPAFTVQELTFRYESIPHRIIGLVSQNQSVSLLDLVLELIRRPSGKIWRNGYCSGTE